MGFTETGFPFFNDSSTAKQTAIVRKTSSEVTFIDPSPIISFRNFPRSDAVASRIEEKIRKLEQYYDRIISCRVVVQAPHRHNTKGKLYQVHIHLGLPGDDIVVGKDSAKDHSHEDVYIAVRDSFEALRRQLNPSGS